MKKMIAMVCAVMVAVGLLVSMPVEAQAFGNRSWFDTTYTFTEAVVFRGDGEEQVKLRSWCDYENSDMIQITLENGDTYLTHSSNVILISRGK